MNISLDHIDLQILDKMQGNARVSNADLARDLSMAPSAILERVKKLEQKDVIRRYTTSINPAALEQKLLAFIFIRTSQGFSCCSDTGNLLSAIPEVQVVQHVLGLFDYRLRVVARDIADFERVLRRRIMTLPGVGNVEANVLLTEERRPGPLGVAETVVKG